MLYDNSMPSGALSGNQLLSQNFRTPFLLGTVTQQQRIMIYFITGWAVAQTCCISQCAKYSV